ncbi:hypothetical protein [Paludibacterium denitrificans]|uniref:hypothetical protein n=1 Tax=Paludibacterium denitrificans TaxID=2675226 RepID=UPI001E543080|nr:hypothetical protein [Paludibacterium denitrificans]
MKRFLMVAGMAVMLTSALVRADAELLARPDVQRYIDEQVASGQFNRAELEVVFANVSPKPS